MASAVSSYQKNLAVGVAAVFVDIDESDVAPRGAEGAHVPVQTATK